MFFVGLALTAAGSVTASPVLWAAALLTLACAALVPGERIVLGVTPLALAVAGYVAWTAANVFLNSPYTSAGIFHPAFLAAGFLLMRRLDVHARESALGAVLVGVSLLAGWALWQAASGAGRGHAFFETPNTLATILNLALAPLLMRIALGDARRLVLLLACVLSAALVATLSRGGLIALAAGLSLTALVCGWRPTAIVVVRLLGVLGLGAMLGALALELPSWLNPDAVHRQAQLDGIATTLGATLSSRMELYRLAWTALGEHPWVGNGYLGFHALFEAGRAQVPSYAAENITYFVHNDYLQTLVELGVPGLVALAALIALPFYLSRRVTSPDATSLLRLRAALAGVAAMAIHALGDFPFYVPLCLLLFGALLAEIDCSVPHHAEVPRRTARRNVAGIVAASLVALLVVPPALADAVSLYGERSWRTGHGESAAFGFELARRLAPRDWRYHWYAGQYWYAQAIYGGKKEAAERADRAFAAAVQANAMDPRPLLGRLATQLRFGPVLVDRQSPQTLRRWAERALALAPVNPAVRKDYAAALVQLRTTQ